MDARKFFYACLIVAALILSAGLVFMLSACQQSPQTEQPVVIQYENLPALADTVDWQDLQSVTPYAASLLKQVMTDAAVSNEARDQMVASILQDDVRRMKDYRKTVDRNLPTDGYVTKGCDCGGTHTCEFTCIGGKKLIITHVPNCCHCYESLSHTGGVIECGDSGCQPKSVSCSMTN